MVTDTGDKADQVSLDKVNIGFTPTVAKVEAEEADLAGTLKVANDHWFYSGEGLLVDLEQQEMKSSLKWMYQLTASTY